MRLAKHVSGRPAMENAADEPALPRCFRSAPKPIPSQIPVRGGRRPGDLAAVDLDPDLGRRRRGAAGRLPDHDRRGGRPGPPGSAAGNAPDQVTSPTRTPIHLLGLQAILAAFPTRGRSRPPSPSRHAGTDLAGRDRGVELRSSPGNCPTPPVAPAPLAGPDIAIGSSTAHIFRRRHHRHRPVDRRARARPGPVVSGDVGLQRHAPVVEGLDAGVASQLAARRWRSSSRSTPGTIIRPATATRRPRTNDARRQVAGCRRYLLDFEAALQRSSKPGRAIDWMTDRHPGLRTRTRLWVAAFDLPRLDQLSAIRREGRVVQIRAYASSKPRPVVQGKRRRVSGMRPRPTEGEGHDRHGQGGQQGGLAKGVAAGGITRRAGRHGDGRGAAGRRP